MDAGVQENFVAVDESVNLVAVAVDSANMVAEAVDSVNLVVVSVDLVNLAAVRQKCVEVDWEKLEVDV